MSYAVFAGLAPLSLLAMAWLSAALWRRRSAPGARPLLAIFFLGAAWLAFEFAEMVAPTARLSLAAEQAIYLVIPWMGVAWFAFAHEFTGRVTRLRTPVLLIASLAAGVTNAVALTATSHGLLWTSVEPVVAGPFRGNVTAYGAWFWVHAGVSWATIGAGSLLILWEYARSRWAYRRLSTWLAVGATLPVVVNVLFVFDLVPIEKSFTTVSFALAAAAFAQGILRYRLLDLRPTARAALVDWMSEGLLVLDREGRVTDFNPVLDRLLGLPVALGDPLTRAVPALDGALRQPEGELTVGPPDTPRQLDWRATDMGVSGRTRGRLVLLRDVTARRTAEAALRDALTEVRLQNQDLDAFAHTVAHDLKNPIHTIAGYAELLRDEGAAVDADLFDESLDVISRTAQTMDSIVRELLLLASVRTQRVAPEPLDMAAVFASARERLAPFLDGHGATVEVSDLGPAALGYGPWVEEVWTNYLSNAAKYGGHPPRIRVGSEGDGATVRFWVEDDGPGLAPEERAEVFVPFTRFHVGSVEGHGLGLSIVRRVLDALGGAYGVEAAASGGSRFWFALPAASASGADEAAEQAGRAVLA